MTKEYEYQTNCTLAMKRQADYKTLNELRKVFVAAKGLTDEAMEGFSGNLAYHFHFNIKTKKARLGKEWGPPNENFAGLYKMIPSALVLYRLCAFDEVSVSAYGQEGYKCIWSIPLVHIPSGRLIFFGEHKGAFSFWTAEHGAERKDKTFIKDLARFLTYLVSDNFAHPYDGLVAGSVA